MVTQPTTQLIQWQDFKVRSEVDIVFEIAHQKGWKDCEIFGKGEMITGPLESKGWKLIPADLYEYNIPAQGVVRVLQTIQAGVRIKGIIIADDLRRKVATPAAPEVLLPSAKSVASFIGKALLGLIYVVGFIIISPLLLLGAVFNSSAALNSSEDYDPKLIILVDDGDGGTAWVSLLTWYD